MWQLLVAQAVGSGVSALMTEKSNKQLTSLNKKMNERRTRNIRDEESLQLEAMSENFIYKMQSMNRDYIEGMDTLNRELRSKGSSINTGTVQKGVTTTESSISNDLKTLLNDQYIDAVTVNGAVQSENIEKMSNMNADSRVAVIRESRQAIIDGKYDTANVLGSIAQSTANAFSQVGMSVGSAVASYGMDSLAKSKTASKPSGTKFAPEGYNPNASGWASVTQLDTGTKGGTLTWN